MSSPQSTQMQLLAALAAMSEANLALRAGAAAGPAIGRAARCLDALADCPDLAPALRRLCDRLSCQWASTTAPPGDCPLYAAAKDLAEVIPLRRSSH